MKNIKLVVGKWARVGTGNGTFGHIIDGDNVQERANKNYNKYWGETSHIFERGIEGAGLVFEGEDMTICGDLYKNESYAQIALNQILSQRASLTN